MKKKHTRRLRRGYKQAIPGGNYRGPGLIYYDHIAGKFVIQRLTPQQAEMIKARFAGVQALHPLERSS